MRYITRFRFLLMLAALAVGICAPVYAIWPNDHLNQAEDWIFNPYVDPANNVYGTPASITVDPDGTVHAIAMCGSFTALLLEAAYPGAITEQVVKDLTFIPAQPGHSAISSYPPFAQQWYNGIATERASASGIQFHKRSTVINIQPGDILAGSYITGSDTGHVMTVKSIAPTAANIILSTEGAGLVPDKGIPSVARVNKYQVTVYDSTDSPHGGYASNPAPDTRYKHVLSGGTVQWVNDTGIGSGTIVLYEDVATGQLVAWAWNVSPSTLSYYYAFSFGSTSYQVRPIVAGYLTGPGL